jgi:hypothetical protein
MPSRMRVRNLETGTLFMDEARADLLHCRVRIFSCDDFVPAALKWRDHRSISRRSCAS